MTKKKMEKQKRIKERYNILAEEMDLRQKFHDEVRAKVEEMGVINFIRNAPKVVTDKLPTDLEELSFLLKEKPWREQPGVVAKLLKTAKTIIYNEDNNIGYETDDEGKVISILDGNIKATHNNVYKGDVHGKEKE